MRLSRKELMRNGVWAEKVGFHMLWYEYLALSPSYHLAHLYRTDSLPSDGHDKIPEDFERVLQVYDDFGDLQQTTFKSWWRERGLDLCGHIGEKPRVTKVSAFGSRLRSNERVTSQTEEYLNNRWLEQGRQNTVLVAIPIGLPKSRIAKQINAIVSAYDDRHKSVRPPEPKYRLAGKRQNSEMLFRYLQVLHIRSLWPDRELWRVGARSKVSETYSPVLDAEAKVVRHEGVVDRQILAILTSRALLRAKMISENAARGVFPSYKNNPHAVDFDLQLMHRRWAERRKLQKLENANEQG